MKRVHYFSETGKIYKNVDDDYDLRLLELDLGWVMIIRQGCPLSA